MEKQIKEFDIFIQKLDTILFYLKINSGEPFVCGAMLREDILELLKQEKEKKKQRKEFLKDLKFVCDEFYKEMKSKFNKE